ncbi:MAG TPA: MMPL family transporter, partial [Candidatus Limnocylindrales bacterium]
MSLFYRLGHACARHHRLVIAVWAGLLLLALPLAPQLPGALRSGGFTTDDLEASRARHVLEAELGMAPSAMVIVIQSTTDARAGEPAFELAAARVLAGVPQARYVDELLTHHLAPRQVSQDGRTVYAIVTLDLPPDDSPLALEPVQAALTDVPGMRAFLAGGPAFYGDIQTVSEHDLQRSELISLPLAAIALLLVFGSVVAAGVPIAVGGGAVVIALALIFLATHLTPFSIFVLNLATLLGLGLGVDYALLMTSRFREELAIGDGGLVGDGGVVGDGVVATRDDIDAAVARAVATAGRAVFFSGLTVLLGLVGLMLFEFMILRSVGLAGAIVVAMAVTAALTLLPATLAFLGPRIDALAVPRPWLRRVQPGAWGRLARRVMRRPGLVFV